MRLHTITQKIKDQLKCDYTPIHSSHIPPGGVTMKSRVGSFSFAKPSLRQSCANLVLFFTLGESVSKAVERRSFIFCRAEHKNIKSINQSQPKNQSITQNALDIRAQGILRFDSCQHPLLDLVQNVVLKQVQLLPERILHFVWNGLGKTKIAGQT